jgi:acetoin utilization protein AcuB
MFTIWNVTGVARPYGGPSPVAAAARVGAADRVDDGFPLPTPPRRDPYAQAGRWRGDAPEQRRRVVSAGELMSSPVVALGPDATVGEAWAVVRDRRFRHIPIVNEYQRLIGIISDRDLLRIAGTPDAAPQPGFHSTPVRQFMKDEVFSAHPDTSVRAVARVMFDERIGSMPVVDEEGTLLGLITRSDVLRVLVNEAPLELWI